VSGCGKVGEDATSYFPFEEGRTWVYGRTLVAKDGSIIRRDQRIVINLAPRELNNVKTIPRITEFLRPTDFGRTEKINIINFYGHNSTGIYDFAKQEDSDIEPIIKEPNYIIIYPIKAGSISKKGDIKIESIDDSITVPAGTFNRCLKIRKTYKKESKAVELIYWYAKEIGIVKIVVFQPNKQQVILQLLSFKK
jgi:hypothetical protein